MTPQRQFDDIASFNFALKNGYKPLIKGCNYHTTWQSHKAMRFVLSEVNGETATLHTRTTGKRFTTNVSDLIFIKSPHNIVKGFKKQTDRKNILQSINP